MGESVGWTKAFYAKQAEWLGLVDIWATLSPDGQRGRGMYHATAMKRLAGPGPKRVLELGCGSGLIAGAIAERGHRVVAVDITDAAAASARRVASLVTGGEMTVVQGSFYEIELSGTFDVVCYFDGFGIGTDADQRRLLRRIAAWLRPEGAAAIDIYAPWAFYRETGEPYRDRAAMARDGFDFDGCRTRNTIWREGRESQAVTQSLRCYSPADLRLLLEGTGLMLETYEPYASDEHAERVPLAEAEMYLAKLVHVRQ